MWVVVVLYAMVIVVCVFAGNVFFLLGHRHIKRIVTDGNSQKVAGTVLCFREFNDYLRQGGRRYKDYEENKLYRRAVVSVCINGVERKEVMSAHIPSMNKKYIGKEVSLRFKDGKDSVLLFDTPAVIKQYNKLQFCMTVRCLLGMVCAFGMGAWFIAFIYLLIHSGVL